MATVTEPIALDESINTTENPSRNIADVLAEELKGIADNILPPNASQIAFDNTGTSLSSDNVEGAIKEVAVSTPKNGILGVTYYEIGKIVIATLNAITITGDNIDIGLPPTNRKVVVTARDENNGNLATFYFNGKIQTYKGINITDGNLYSATFVYVKS